jgi:hypothetical protein
VRVRFSNKISLHTSILFTISKKNGHYTGRPTCVSAHVSLNIKRKKSVQEKSRKNDSRILCPINFPYV